MYRSAAGFGDAWSLRLGPGRSEEGIATSEDKDKGFEDANINVTDLFFDTCESKNENDPLGYCAKVLTHEALHLYRGRLWKKTGDDRYLGRGDDAAIRWLYNLMGWPQNFLHPGTNILK